jgi:hypothetical protein
MPAAAGPDRLLEQTREVLESLLDRAMPAAGEAGWDPLPPYGPS